MRDLNENNITDAVLTSIAKTDDPRVKEVLSAVVRHLHDLGREVRPTHAEWGAVIDFLFRAGKISTPERNEFILASDILGVSSLVDIINGPPPGGTEVSVLGPFYIADQEILPIGADLVHGQPGEPITVQGHVRSAAGAPLAGAMLDFWQTAANGLYDVQDDALDGYNLRARMATDAAGWFQFRTVRPCPYTVPDDGPVGDVLRATGRHPWRPAHLHFKVSADGHRSIVTELFPADDKYVDEDAVFACAIRWRSASRTPSSTISACNRRGSGQPAACGFVRRA